VPVLTSIIQSEMSTLRSDDFLRGESLAAFLLKTLWWKFEGKKYLKHVIRPIVLKICSASKTRPLEIDYLKVSQHEAEKNLNILLPITKSFLDTLFVSHYLLTDTFDTILKTIHRLLQDSEGKGKSHLGLGVSETGLQLFGGFVLLRLICPAIVSPQKYGLVKDVSVNAQRSLVLISKIVQSIANHSKFEGSYMEATNNLIDFSFAPMMAFILKLGEDPKPATKSK